MARKLGYSIAVMVALAFLAGCGPEKSDVRQTSFTPVTGGSRAPSFDTAAPWSCDEADLQAVFAPTLTGDELLAAIKATIADPNRPEAAFSFLEPINSFYTEFADNALCMELDGTDRGDVDALVNQLRKSGNVVSVRVR